MKKHFYSSFAKIFNSTCAICGIGNSVLCDVCQNSITKPDNCCLVCGKNIIGDRFLQYCQQCIKMPPAYESLYYIGNYDEVLSSLIIKAKIGKQLSAILALQKLIDVFVNNYPDWGHKFKDYHLLAMPISRYRLMQRGFNLPLLFAKRLSMHFDLPIIPQDSVTLPFFVRKQARLNRKQRKVNLHHYKINVSEFPKKVIIVDDVVATGTTVGHLSKCLRSQKVKSISVWAMARVNEG